MLCELFDRKELGRLYNVLIEKELRIHRELGGLENGPIGGLELPKDASSDEE